MGSSCGGCGLWGDSLVRRHGHALHQEERGEARHWHACVQDEGDGRICCSAFQAAQASPPSPANTIPAATSPSSFTTYLRRHWGPSLCPPSPSHPSHASAIASRTGRSFQGLSPSPHHPSPCLVAPPCLAIRPPPNPLRAPAECLPPDEAHEDTPGSKAHDRDRW